MAASCREAFIRMPELFGQVSMLEEAGSLVQNERSLSAIRRLRDVYEVLRLYGLADYVSFDLGMVSKYKYYTGVIFQAYTYGTGEAIVKGGRYDNLLSRFGKDFAATGFAVVVDQLMNALSRQKIEIPVTADGMLILYGDGGRESAIRLARHYRGNGRSVELMKREEGSKAAAYEAFAVENGHRSILCVEENAMCTIWDLSSKELRRKDMDSILKEGEVPG